MIDKERQANILKKKKLLESTKEQLKKEFIGIDCAIEQIIKNVSSWYLFPDIQEKPIIINLFGLTGVGKTGLIKRLVELLNIQNQFYHFDLGEKDDDGRTFRNLLEDIYEYSNDKESVLVFDEFQHIKSIKPSGEDIERPQSRIIWEILDSGTFKIQRDSYLLESLCVLYKKLDYALKKGIIVKNGVVVEGCELFEKEIHTDTSDFTSVLNNQKHKKNDILYFIPEKKIEDIFDALDGQFITKNTLKEYTRTIDGPETMQLILKSIDILSSFKVVNCQKSIIFVIANLDELFTMNSDYNPDMSADHFHEQSLKITVPNVKKELSHMFRSEQVARLGNNYVIYPAFDSTTFKQIISLELEKIRLKVFKTENINIEFDKSFETLIYKEGVYPSQGTRPVHSTIYQFVYTKLGKILEEKILHNINCDKIVYSNIEDTNIINISYYKNKKIIHYFDETQQLSLNHLRENKKNGYQSSVAVHESGHTVLMLKLLKECPEMVYSVTADYDSAGFTLQKYSLDKIETKESIKNYAAMLMGGFIAEELIFGKPKVTFGSSKDIEVSTNYIAEAIKRSGMGGILGKIEHEDDENPYVIHDIDSNMNKILIKFIKDAEKLARTTLRKEKKLLVFMSKYLSENTHIKKEEIKKLVDKYSKYTSKNGCFEEIEDRNLFYKNKLNDVCKKIND